MTALKAHARAACFGLLLLALAVVLLAPSHSSRAQSGRKKESPAPDSSKGKTTATPTPTPARLPREGPIAEPPPPEIRSAPPRRVEGTPAPSPEPVSARTTPAASSQQKQGAQKPPADDEVGEDEVVTISSNLVPLPATVVDAQGRAVPDLKPEDFELKVDGQVKPIGDLTHAETPASIVVLFDNSSSLNATRDFERAAGVRFLKSVIRQVDRAAVFSIATEPELSHPLTNNVNALVRTIESFPKPDAAATALFDTIVAAADYIKPLRTRKVMVIISDGTDTVSTLGFDDAMSHLVAADCQVYAVQTGNSASPNLHDAAGAHRFREFSAQTGGAVYVPSTHDELTQAFKQIATDLSQQYVLSYYPTGEPRDGRFHTFSLSVKTRPGLRVRTRRGYYSPKG
ncbi:MAG TPA: VWA domain-containing protein [Pyrinomonadaceae bacterium]|nr:VWA domain-containing protein [Pyrinomonadaceae bacterium]